MKKFLVLWLMMSAASALGCAVETEDEGASETETLGEAPGDLRTARDICMGSCGVKYGKCDSAAATEEAEEQCVANLLNCLTACENKYPPVVL